MWCDLWKYDRLAIALILVLLVHYHLAWHSRNTATAPLHIEVLRIHAVPGLITLNEDRDASTIWVLLRQRLLHFDASTRVLFELATNFVMDLCIIAIVRVIRHFSVLTRAAILKRI